MCHTSPYTKGLRKLNKVRTHTGEGSSLGPGYCDGTLLLGRHNPTDLMIIESSVSDKDALWRFLAGPVR